MSATHPTGRVLAAAVAVVLAAGADLTRAGKDDADTTRHWPDGVRQMVRFLKVDEEQQQRIAKVLEKHAADNKTLAATRADKLREIAEQRQLIEQRMKPLLDQLRPLQEKLEALDQRERTLNDDRRDLAAVQQAEFDAMFTPAQRFAWDVYQMAELARRRLWGIKIDAAQRARIDQLAEQAVMKRNRQSEVTTDKRVLSRLEHDVETELYSRVYEEVLTEENRVAVDTARLAYEVSRTLNVPRFSAEQYEKLQELTRPYAEKLRKLTGRQQRDAQKAAMAEIRQAAIDSVLTPEQKARLKP